MEHGVRIVGSIGREWELSTATPVHEAGECWSKYACNLLDGAGAAWRWSVVVRVGPSGGFSSGVDLLALEQELGAIGPGGSSGQPVQGDGRAGVGERVVG
jgi:hypothetical protein